MEKVYHKPSQTVHDLTQELKQEIKDKDNVDEYAKILALPQHFSDKHLQAIVDGKMKDGDGVLVKCKKVREVTHENMGWSGDCKIHLNQQNHITLFPAKQSLEEAANEYRSNNCYNSDPIDVRNMAKRAFKAGAKYQGSKVQEVIELLKEIAEEGDGAEYVNIRYTIKELQNSLT